MAQNYKDWQPDPEQMALMPAISGNSINGLGEEVPRHPTPVYWATNPADIAHGDVQLWFYQRNDKPEISVERARRIEAQQVPLAPLAPQAALYTPQDWRARVDVEARRIGADAVGVARVDPAWAYEGRSLPWQSVIVMAIAMDPAEIAKAPELPAAAEVMRQYTRGVATARAMASWLRAQGHEAQPEAGPMTGDMVLIPAALAAGLGELGKHGSIINRDLGACFRLAAVLTNVDIAPSLPDEFGADGFCTHCRICADACPPQAILPQKATVRGVEKWYVDFDACLPFFNETAGCGICVAVCPFSRPEMGENLVAKLARRAARRAQAVEG
jgi:epoxyqueuosine reductase